jgi:hypothetical protein
MWNKLSVTLRSLFMCIHAIAGLPVIPLKGKRSYMLAHNISQTSNNDKKKVVCIFDEDSNKHNEETIL